MNRNLLWIILLWASLICTAQPSYGSILIGRITYAEGNVLTYSEEEEDWVEAGSNAPVGAEDGFYTEEGAKAELVFPNDTMLRMGELTEVEVLRIEKNFTEVYIRTGIVRAYSRGRNTLVKVGTAMGYVEIPSQGTVDFFVDDRSTEIVSLQEDILFHKTVGADAPETHRIRAGFNSLIFSLRHVETGTVLADTPWNRWCLERDTILEKQAAIRSAHLPSSLQIYSHELEPYGEWGRMKYRGYYYWFWRPVHVNVGWTPFAKGRWKRWHREYVWVSAEPWGWCTHHYGNWINLHGAWWWTPYIHTGVSFPGISLVNLHIHFGPLFKPFWHPGRVAWISTTSHVGWIPLAPWESYYGCRKWGPRTVVVKKIGNLKNRHRIGRYAYRDHSLIVSHQQFRRVSPHTRHDYRKLMVRGVKRNAILRDSKPTYGRHKMAMVKQNVLEAKKKNSVGRQRTITKPNRFEPSNPSVKVSRERAALTPKKKTSLPRKGTGDRIAKITKRPPLPSGHSKSGVRQSPQVSTAPAPRKPFIKQENAARQNLNQTRPKQSARQPSTPPRVQHIRKKTVPTKSGPSMMSTPSKDAKKWVSPQSRQNPRPTVQNTTPVKVPRERAALTPKKKTTPPRKQTGDRTAKITKGRPSVSNHSKPGVNKSPQASTAPTPRKPFIKQENATRQNLRQARPAESARQPSTPPRVQYMNRKTVLKKSGPSPASPPSKDPPKWASSQSRQKRGAKGRNTNLR
jgi:hypothetical protein